MAMCRKLRQMKRTKSLSPEFIFFRAFVVEYVHLLRTKRNGLFFWTRIATSSIKYSYANVPQTRMQQFLSIPALWNFAFNLWYSQSLMTLVTLINMKNMSALILIVLYKKKNTTFKTLCLAFIFHDSFFFDFREIFNFYQGNFKSKKFRLALSIWSKRSHRVNLFCFWS